MTIGSKEVKYLSDNKVAKLVGLPLHEMRAMRKRGEGPPFLGVEPYVTYRDEEVELWARMCVRAPDEWFMRFDHPDPDNLWRTYIHRIGNCYYLSLCEARLSHHLKQLSPLPPQTRAPPSRGSEVQASLRRAPNTPCFGSAMK
jgi:hypothetical protein